MSYQVEIENLDELKHNLSLYPDISRRWLEKAVRASVMEVMKHAVKGVLPWKTGALTQTMAQETNGLSGRVFPTRKYAEYVHNGRGPFIIRPKNKKALFWPGASHPMRAVHHPGIKANPFLPRMLNLANAEIQKHFKDANEGIVKDVISK